MNVRGRAPGSRRVLRRNLWRVGRWGRSPGGVGALRTALLVLGCVSMSVGLASAVLASAFYGHRADINRARTPVVTDPGGAGTQLWWQFANAAVGDRIVGLYAVEPVAESPPLPPGVARWPRPGEAVLSPALHALLSERSAVDRFGTVAGLIAREGLASQTELLAYARLPRSLDRARAWPVTSFGVDGPGVGMPIGDLLYDRSVVEFWSLALVLMVLPGAMALGAAARVADTGTRRRQVLLARLGADRRARAVAALPPLLLPCVASLAFVSAAVLVASTVDVRIPFKGNVLDAAVIQSALVPLLAVVAATHAVVVCALAFAASARPGELGAARLVAPEDDPARVRTVLLLVVLAAQPWLLALTRHQTVRSLSTLAAAAVGVICLPAALATALRAVSVWRARRDVAAGRVGPFLGWKITRYRSRAAARLAGTICGLIVVVGHAAAVLAMFTGPALEARRISDRVGTALLVAAPGPVEVARADIVAFARDRDLAVATAARSWSRDLMVLGGTCADLSVLDVPCRDGPLAFEQASEALAALSSWYGGGVEVAVAADDGWVAAAPGATAEQADVLVLSRDGTDLDGLALARAAHHEGLALRIEPLGASWLLGATELLHKSYWVFVYGIPGVLTLLVASALTWAAVVIEESAALVSSPVLAEQDGVFAAVAAVRVGLPVALGGLAGAASTAWLLAPHQRSGAVDVPAAFLATAAIGAVFVAVAATVVARRLMARASQRR